MSEAAGEQAMGRGAKIVHVLKHELLIWFWVSADLFVLFAAVLLYGWAKGGGEGRMEADADRGAGRPGRVERHGGRRDPAGSPSRCAPHRSKKNTASPGSVLFQYRALRRHRSFLGQNNAAEVSAAERHLSPLPPLGRDM